jgi:hypothetical protein
MGIGEHANADDRLSLDDLVALMKDPGFATQHRRPLSLRETSRHVNPLMLAVATRDSLYVRDWRNHSRGCTACRKLFEYFGLA